MKSFDELMTHVRRSARVDRQKKYLLSILDESDEITKKFILDKLNSIQDDTELVKQINRYIDSKT